MEKCLPIYRFRVLDSDGWNFREAKYHEEDRRTLSKLYGLKVLRSHYRPIKMTVSIRHFVILFIAEGISGLQKRLKDRISKSEAGFG